MKKQIKEVLLLLLMSIAGFAARSQERKWEDIDTTGFYKKQVINRSGYELTFINKEPKFNMVTEQQMIDLFFEVYPEEVKRFNPEAARNITFVVTSEYKGVAATLGTIIKFDPDWLARNPEDIDCATHELMHVIQSYHGENNPGWLVEGIADYGRNTFGINNGKSKWELTPYRQGQSYTNAYRITARFLLWTEQRYDKKLVNELDRAMRTDRYTDKLWKKLTGKSVDELWYLYTTDPVIA